MIHIHFRSGSLSLLCSDSNRNVSKNIIEFVGAAIGRPFFIFMRANKYAGGQWPPLRIHLFYQMLIANF